MWPQILEGLRIAHSGASRNLWGLGCLFYCTSPSLGTILAFALLGLITGFALGLWVAYLLYSWASRPASLDIWNARPQAEEAGPIARRRRLQGYVHG